MRDLLLLMTSFGPGFRPHPHLTKLLFGTGKLGELHKAELPGRKALLLLSQGQSVHKNGSYDKTVSEL